MPVRRFPPVAIAAVVVSLVGLTAVPAEAAAYRAERFDTHVVIESGGAIRVTETIRFAFGPEAFISVSREVPSRRTDGLTVLEATLDGVTLERGSKAGQFEWRREDDGRRRIVWHFPPTSNASRTFTVTYRAAGVAWQDAGGDVLAWRLLPSRHSYAIDCASGRIEYPASAALVEPPTLSLPPSAMLTDGRAFSFERCPVGPNESWIVTLRFAPRTLAASPPAWQAKAARSRQNLPLFLGLAAMILIAGVGGFAALALGQRTGLHADHEQRLHAPPDDLPPALAGALLRPGAAAGWGDVLGAVLDLGRRGAIRIEAKPSSGLFRQHDARLTKGEIPSDLMAHERAVLDLLFTDKSGARPSVTFSHVASAVASARRWKRLREAVADDLRKARLLDPERERTRGRVIVLGVAILVLALVGFVVTVAFIDRAGDSLLALPAAVLIVGIAGIVTGTLLSPLSEEAARRAGRWRAYRRSLLESSVASGGTGLPFERLLPYAAAFGIALPWAKRLQRQGLTGGPSWMVTAAQDGTMVPVNIGGTIAVLSAGSNAGARAGRSGGGAAHVTGAAGGGASRIAG